MSNISTVTVKGVDIPLLREQRNFLLEYPWGGDIPEHVDGLINLLDHMLNLAEQVTITA